jgi:hypothetical protein
MSVSFCRQVELNANPGIAMADEDWSFLPLPITRENCPKVLTGAGFFWWAEIRLTEGGAGVVSVTGEFELLSMSEQPKHQTFRCQCS